MTNIKYSAFFLFAPALLPGCGIGGFWMNGDPFAYKSIKSYIEKWEKLGTAAEARQQDSSTCGGGTSNPAVVEQARRPHETASDTLRRLTYEWERCMLRKGYHFTGKCNDEIMRARPACGAP